MLQTLSLSIPAHLSENNALDAQYNKMRICFNGLFGWYAHVEEVKKDIKIAKL